jgi:hypothetical protein
MSKKKMLTNVIPYAGEYKQGDTLVTVKPHTEGTLVKVANVPVSRFNIVRRKSADTKNMIDKIVATLVQVKAPKAIELYHYPAFGEHLQEANDDSLTISLSVVFRGENNTVFFLKRTDARQDDSCVQVV